MERNMSAKSRWRGVTKLLGKDRENQEEDTPPAPQDSGLDDFLAPSREKAAARFAVRPKIDISAAQRWPDASDVRKAMSPAVNSAIKGGRVNKRGKILTVAFVRVAPEIIGDGGDECEEPVIEVSKRKTQGQAPPEQTAGLHQDDSRLNLSAIPSPPQPPAQFAPVGRPQPAAEPFFDRSAIPTRAETSAREMSASLRANLEKRKSPPLPQTAIPAGEGLGFRPKPIARVATGLVQDEDTGPGRHSYDSDAPSMRSLNKTQSNFSSDLPISPEEEEPSQDILQRSAASSEAEVEDPKSSSSFAARMQARIKMRAEEGKAFSQALLRKRLDENGRPSSAQSSSSTELSPPEVQKALSRSSHEKRLSDPKSSLDSKDGSNSHLSTRQPASPYQQPLPSPRFTDGRGAFLEAASPPSPRSSPNPASYRRPPMVGSTSQPGDITTAQTQPPHSPSFLNAPSQQQPPPSPGFRQPLSQTQSPPSPMARSPQPPQHHQQQQLPQPPSILQPSRPPQQPPPPSPGFTRQAQDPAYQQSAPPSRSGSQAQRTRTDTVTSGMSTDSGGDSALDDFSERVTHMKSSFELTAQKERPLADYTPMQFMRAAMWWFLRGRVGLEEMFRSRPRDGSTPRQVLMQPHVDLAKVLWITTDLMRSHPRLREYGDESLASQAKLARDVGDGAMAEIYDLNDMIVGNLRALIGSMSRNASMPPDNALIQGQDQMIWIDYPRFAPDMVAMLSAEGLRPRSADGSVRAINPGTLMPLGDTQEDFCYARMFVKASLQTDDAETDRVALPCVATILRPRSNFPLKVTIASQNELVNTVIHIDRRTGVTWADVQWKTKNLSLRIQLPRGFVLNVEFNERDFRQLWSIYDYTSKIERSLLPEPDDEIMAHEVMLRDFQYSNPANPHAFTQERVQRCLVRIFERIEHVPSSTGLRKYHRGCRLLIVTSPKNKTLSSVSHIVGQQEPLDFEFKADSATPDATPVLVLRVKDTKETSATATIFMGFKDPKERNGLFTTLTGMNPTKDETVFAQVPLKGLSLSQPGTEAELTGPLDALQWQDVKVINSDPENANSDIPKTVLSEHLRVVARHAAGSWTDWMNMGSGETQLRLDTESSPNLYISRGPQGDLTASIDSKRAPQNISGALGGVLKTLQATPSIRTMKFQNLPDLHTFITATTGFTVRFDGLASTFSIARRRMVVPIYKKWEAQSVRILILERLQQYQLACFFENFTHAEAMNFTVKQMDVFEKVDKSKLSREGTWGVKLVDAKFGLPGGKGEGREGKGEKSRFVSLDYMEYAGEHDDITVGFEDKQERDRFSDALPAATQVSRAMTMRRKI